MPLVFYSADDEFATSTGTNIGAYGDTSTFDDVPGAMTNLVITANADDTDPRLFEPGDTYDISYDNGGLVTLENAVVIRSDPDPGGGNGGVIVFSGLNADGELTKVLWTPDTNLAEWYDDNSGPDIVTGFYTVDSSPEYSYEILCFGASTRISIPGGQKAAIDLRAGDRVITRDEGVRTLVWTGAKTGPGTGQAAPVRFEPGSLGNSDVLYLSQQHRVLVSSSRAELLFGTREVFVPAKAMINGRTIRTAPRRQITYVHLLLRKHQVLIAEGAPCESLLVSDMVMDIVSPDDRTSGSLGTASADVVAARPVLTYREARVLLSNPHDRPPVDAGNWRVQKTARGIRLSVDFGTTPLAPPVSIKCGAMT